MYLKHFGFSEPPFSIAPDPRYLYMSERHREALAHLLYGIETDGGFVLLTGEVGTGKTTLCRCLVERIPENCDLAFIFNPKLTIEELLSTICDELRIGYPSENRSVKVFVDLLNERLLRTNAEGRKTLLIIDEAQNLSDDVLEQIRLLTNLETNQRKLLQVALVAQPELRQRLAQPNLRQLAQRIVARYHLNHLTPDELKTYVNHRLAVAGVPRPLFAPRVLERLYRLSGGIPRLINVICDRALLGAFTQQRNDVDRKILDTAAREVSGEDPRGMPASRRLRWEIAALLLTGIGAVLAAAYYDLGAAHVPLEPGASAGPVRAPEPPPPAAPSAEAVAAASKAEAATIAAPAASPALPTDGSVALSEATAVAALFRLWGTAARSGGVETACRLAAEDGLRCVTGSDSLEQVRDFDLAAVVMLREENGSESFITLLSINGDRAKVLVNGIEKMLPLDELKQRWAGRTAILWRGPSGLARTLALEARGSDVAWVARRLARIEGREETGIPDELVYASDLKRRVSAFQSAHGLQPDGIAGPRTLARLSALGEPDAPRLSRKDQP